MLRAMDVDEPGDELAVDMLAALPESEAVFYASEDNVVDARNYAQAVYQEIEQRFGFVNGTYYELIKCRRCSRNAINLALAPLAERMRRRKGYCAGKQRFLNGETRLRESASDVIKKCNS